MNSRIVGIMGAMPEEIQAVADLLSNREEISFGMRTYYVGELYGIKTIVVFSRWGKVAAATTVSSLILEFRITELIFIGVAGAISSDLKIGDVVVAKRLIQHDMDARPLIAKHEIPLLGITYFETDDAYLDVATKAVDSVLTNSHFHSTIGTSTLDEFDIKTPKMLVGDIASGDKFFSSQADKDELEKDLPSILCVEMEGAAVAQICYEYAIPFMVIRTISDESDEKSPINFSSFIEKIASEYAVLIIRAIYHRFLMSL